MIDLFIRQAEAVGSECHVVGGRAEASEAILAVLEAEGIKDEPGCWAVWSGSGWPEAGERDRITSRLPGVRFDVSRETAAHALVGICEIEWGAAKTGTLVSDSGAVERRLVSTLPPIHIALLPISRIVDDLPAALGRIGAGRRGFVAAITGPSRTADIERVLTIGVHGPRRLLVFLLDDRNEGESRT